jgi:hypothetical protein
MCFLIFIFQWGQYAHPIFSKQGDFPTEVKINVAAKSAEQGYPRSRLPELSAAEVTLIRGSSDFFGVNTYTSKLTYRDASLEGMYPVPSYLDDMGSVMIKDPSWPQAESPWLQVRIPLSLLSGRRPGITGGRGVTPLGVAAPPGPSGAAGCRWLSTDHSSLIHARYAL